MTEDDATEAIRKMHRVNIFGSGLINVEYSKSDFPVRKRSDSRDDSRGRLKYSRNPPNSRIFLGCLSIETTEGELRDKFSRFGDIEDITLKR